jgi:hypothetical protein
MESKQKEYKKEYRRKNKEAIKQYQKENKWNLKFSAFLFYGSRCSCCGEKEIKFLTIDHIKGGGTRHRKKLSNGVRDIYQQIIFNPLKRKLYTVLCMNCNWAKGIYGECPHSIRVI